VGTDAVGTTSSSGNEVMPAAAAAADATANSLSVGPLGGGAAFLAVFLATAFFTGAASDAEASAGAAGKASFSRLTTGASMVEDAERTNSPIS